MGACKVRDLHTHIRAHIFLPASDLMQPENNRVMDGGEMDYDAIIDSAGEWTAGKR